MYEKKGKNAIFRFRSISTNYIPMYIFQVFVVVKHSNHAVSSLIFILKCIRLKLACSCLHSSEARRRRWCDRPGQGERWIDAAFDHLTDFGFPKPKIRRVINDLLKFIPPSVIFPFSLSLPSSPGYVTVIHGKSL
jgi:hypothetical protein